MPDWSPQIANEFIRLAGQDGRAFDQGQLQTLVYIAHGWCLAITGEPLTGDRPEAWEHGPVYRRLADALVSCGLDAVPVQSPDQSEKRFCSDLELKERALIVRVYKEYGELDASTLATLTRRGEAPWKRVYEGGAGKNKDISHQLVKDQFRQLAQQLASHGRRG